MTAWDVGYLETCYKAGIRERESFLMTPGPLGTVPREPCWPCGSLSHLQCRQGASPGVKLLFAEFSLSQQTTRQFFCNNSVPNQNKTNKQKTPTHQSHCTWPEVSRARLRDDLCLPVPRPTAPVLCAAQPILIFRQTSCVS